MDFNSMNRNVQNWEPKKENVVLTKRCITRIQKDTADLIKNPPYGILALPDEEDMQMMNVMIVGPKDTPYQGGLFYFLVQFTSDYPMKPPKVKLLTTANGTVKFGPHLYKNGMVCLNILGTVDSLASLSWSPITTLSGVCVSIQSLLEEKQYMVTSSPEFQERHKYCCNIALHETIRIAVCDVYENLKSYPEHFHEVIEQTIKDNYDYYVEACKTNIDQDGKSLNDRECGSKGEFNFKRLLEKLEGYNLK